MSYDKLEKLILDAKEGDNQAFGVLFERYWSMAYYYCFKYLQNDIDAEDATQEVFITLHRRIHNLKHPEFFAKTVKWLAAEVSRNYADRKKRQANLGAPVAIGEVEATLPEEKEEFLPAELLEKKELKQELIRLIDDLPEKQREAIMLYYFNEMSQKEIAALTESRLGAVRDRIYNAKLTLKANISEKMEKGEIGAMAALPVLTQVFNEEMAFVATAQVKESIWAGIHMKLTAAPSLSEMKPTTEDAPTKPTVGGDEVANPPRGQTVEPASWLRVVAGGAAMTTAACAAVVGVNLYQDLSLFDPADLLQAGPATVEATEFPADDDIVEVLKQIDGYDSFQAFLLRFDVKVQNGTINGEGLAYTAYYKKWGDLEIHLGYQLKGEEFKLAYTVLGDASQREGPALPTDPESWVLENLK